MKIFLTGASGFLGSHTAKELIRRGHHVVALVRKTSRTEALRSLKIKLVEGSLPQTGLEQHLEGADAVIHIAGIVKALSKAEFHRVNAQGTASLVDAILATKQPPKTVLYVSSIAALNPSRDGDDFCLPSEDCHPLTFYGQSKLAGEFQMKKLEGSLRTLILRPPVIYGPGDRELLKIFKAHRWGIAPLLGNGANRLSVCYVTDVSRAIADLVESPATTVRIFCVDDGEIHTWRSFSRTLGAVMGRRAIPLPLPSFLFYAGAALNQAWSQITRRADVFTLNKILEMRQKSWRCGYRQMAALGWRPETCLKDGLARTLDYYRAQAGLKVG